MKRTALLFALIFLLSGVFCLSSAAENESLPQPELQLNPAELRLNRGSGAKVTPTVVHAPRGVRIQKYEWVSSDPAVAAYSGTIRGIGAGQAIMTCTATLSDGTVLSADCPVTVTVPVLRIQSAEKTLTVMAGEPVEPEILVIPEDATNPRIVFTSSDEQILAVGPEGRVTAVAEGKAVLIAEPEGDPGKRIRIPVTVTRRIGRADREITFLGIPWESDCETCIRLLKEKEVIAGETTARFNYTSTAWHWPENDLLFSRISAWRTLPAFFTDRQTGAARTSIRLQKTIGGYLPQTATLVFFNRIGGDGQIDPGMTRLIGVYFSFESRNGDGAQVFRGLLERLEEAYGEFARYLSSDIPRYYMELNDKIGDIMAGAREYGLQELGEGLYLGEYAICTIYGSRNTGIMLNIDTNETVTLFYGRTDAADMIRALQDTETTEPVIMEDAGV